MFRPHFRFFVNPSAAVLAAGALCASSASAVVVGFEGFNYADGTLIAGQTGGTGWAYVRTPEAGSQPQSPSNWNNVTATPSVQGSALITSGSSAKREFGGVTEGSAAGSNEREGAFRGAGVAYFSVNFRMDSLLAEGTGQWGGLSSYDFGTERIFFGVPSQTTATRYLGITGTALGGSTLTNIALEAGRTYHVVGAIDFDADLVKFWVNPDGSDFDNGASHSADAFAAYTGTNWSSAVRLGSGAGFATTWDNLTVADSFANVVPEPASALLMAGLGLGLAARRTRRSDS